MVSKHRGPLSRLTDRLVRAFLDRWDQTRDGGVYQEVMPLVPVPQVPTVLTSPVVIDLVICPRCSSPRTGKMSQMRVEGKLYPLAFWAHIGTLDKSQPQDLGCLECGHLWKETWNATTTTTASPV